MTKNGLKSLKTALKPPEMDETTKKLVETQGKGLETTKTWFKPRKIGSKAPKIGQNPTGGS